MQTKWYDNRKMWLAIGLIGGLCVAYVWPHERALAATSDRSSQFALITVHVGQQGAGLQDPLEGIFVLDFLTGQLKGAVLSRQTGKFVTQYFRNVADDFRLPQKADPRYAISTGLGQMAGRAGITFAAGVIYVGELTTGKIIAYGFGWRETRIPIPAPQPLLPLDFLQFREPTSDNP